MKKTYDEMVNSLRFYRTVTVVLVGLILFIGLNNISTTESADMYKAKYIDCEQTVNDKVKEATKKQRDRILELQSANEALIKVCNPSAFRDVAKKTPLPKMKEA